MSRPPDPDPDRLRDLDARLRTARDRQAGKDWRQPARSRDIGVGFRISIEIAAAIGVGTAIGIMLDRWLGTSPWLLIVFFLIGTAAAFLNVYRVSVELDRKRREAKASQDETEEGRRGGAA